MERDYLLLLRLFVQILESQYNKMCCYIARNLYTRKFRTQLSLDPKFFRLERENDSILEKMKSIIKKPFYNTRGGSRNT